MNKIPCRDGHLPTLDMTAIMAVERNPPKKDKGINWVLLTNMDISNLDEAIEKVEWYALKWNIEVFHKILKSGFSLERCQLRDGCRLKRYITLKCILAWRIFWLTRICKINKSYSCEKVVTKKEWKILHKKFNKNIPLPKKPPSVEEVFIWIGKLGGFIGRKSDGMPGVVSLWRGWMRFMDLVEDYEASCG